VWTGPLNDIYSFTLFGLSIEGRLEVAQPRSSWPCNLHAMSNMKCFRCSHRTSVSQGLQ
jgi:hypothetical protein